MNLSLAAGVALLLVRLQEQRRRDAPVGNWTAGARHYWDKHSWISLGIVLCAVAVFTSMSRNGVISLIVGSAVIAAALYARGTLNLRGWVLGALPAGVLAVVLVFGFDLVLDRLATLRQTDAFDTRWDMTAATLHAWRESPIWGMGLGTHEVVFPMFDTTLVPAVAAHADNDYAQSLEEMGIVGAILIGIFLTGVALTIIKLAVRGRTPLSAAVYGLALGLIAVAIQSATDFGQRLPANFCLTGTFCGLVVAIARVEKRHREVRGKMFQPRRTSPWVRRSASAAAFVVVATIWGFVIRDAYGAYIAERWNAAASAIDSRIRNPSQTPTDEDISNLIAAAEGAARSDPGNVSYQYWLNLYRWQSLNREVDPETGQRALPLEAAPFVRRVADELSAARRLCPTFGPPYALEGQLRLFILNERKGADLIRTGVRLAAYDPPTCLVAGELAAREGRLDDAQPLLARAVGLHPDYFDEVAELYIAELKRPDLARALANDDYQRLAHLARLLAREKDGAELANELQAEAEASLRRRALAADVRANELAALAQIELNRGESASGIELYRRALGQDYPQIDWRLALAGALAETGKLDEALHEVRICLRLRPGHREATRLQADLHSRAENLRSKSNQ
jgi:tetratricopeptide (TPR) repeat protein